MLAAKHKLQNSNEDSGENKHTEDKLILRDHLCSKNWLPSKVTIPENWDRERRDWIIDENQPYH